MAIYLVQLGNLGNFGMGDVYEVAAEDEADAFNWAAHEDGGKQAVEAGDLGLYSEDDLLRTDFSDAAYLGSDVSVTLLSEACGCDGREGVLRKGKNSGDGPEWG